LPRKKSTEARRVPTGIRLDAAILERLGKGERGVSEEIRTRLLRTFAEDDLDAVTRELCVGLINLAAKLKADFGIEWHARPRAHQAFAAGVAQWIADYAPPPREGPPAASDLFYFGPDDEPETVGRMRTRDVQREHNFPHLKSSKERRAEGQRALLARAIIEKRGKHD
jgi:hypothetical protein